MRKGYKKIYIYIRIYTFFKKKINRMKRFARLESNLTQISALQFNVFISSFQRANSEISVLEGGIL